MKFLILFAALVFCLPAARAADEIRISMEGKYPPFEELDDKGNPKGFNVDIANALCEEMKAKCKIVLFPWDDQIPNLLAKKSDAIIASMTINEERKQQVAFTQYYMRSPTFFVAKKHTVPFVYITPKRLVGKRIGVLDDSVQAKYLAATYAASASIVKFKSDPEVYAALQKGAIDLGLFDASAAYYAFLQKPEGKDFELVGSAITDKQFLGEGSGIALRKEDVGLRARFDKALKAILNNGVYQEIQGKYFIFRIY